jgi:hypothetical protein
MVDHSTEVEVRPWRAGATADQGRYAGRLSGPRILPVRENRQAFRGGQRSALRLKNCQKIAM